MASDPADRTPPTAPPLLPRVARGDAPAVRECLARYGSLVLAIARRLVPDDVEDAVQEAFVALWKSAPRFDEARGSEAAFVAMIARRRFIDRRRRASARPEGARSSALPSLPDPSMGPDRGADASSAVRALLTLRPEQQRVLLLSIYHGLSHEEIAEQTGMPLGTVKTHARRGLSRIRATLLGVEEEETS
jgi:RNA polymerase sigma-70 factor (ECF subfamily)